MIASGIDNYQCSREFCNAKHLYNREGTAPNRRNIHNITPHRYDPQMQNQTPTANLQALVPKFTARGQ
jgi:hypothetical protein